MKLSQDDKQLLAALLICIAIVVGVASWAVFG